jgi:hypothetical protein
MSGTLQGTGETRRSRRRAGLTRTGFSNCNAQEAADIMMRHVVSALESKSATMRVNNQPRATRWQLSHTSAARAGQETGNRFEITFGAVVRGASLSRT